MLAWRRRPDEIEQREIEGRPQRIGLDEAERVARLRLDIDADHVEAGTMQPHRRAAGLAEQIEGERPKHVPAPACAI